MFSFAALCEWSLFFIPRCTMCFDVIAIMTFWSDKLSSVSSVPNPATIGKECDQSEMVMVSCFSSIHGDSWHKCLATHCDFE